MTRRFWPAALAAVSILVFGSYLVYTQYLAREIRQQVAIHAQVYSIVQAGVIRIGDEGAPANALLDAVPLFQQLDVPMVVFNAAGEPYIALHPPEDVGDLGTPEGKRNALQFAARLVEADSTNWIRVPGSGEVVFGDPPVLARLKWIPYLQVLVGLLLMVIAFVIMRADMRAHREKLWSAMARELAHQMGTPLSSLSGWVEVLQLTTDERELMADTEHIGRVMQADVERLERVSRRFELIGKPPALQLVRVADVVRELTAYFRPRLPHLGRGITLRERVDAELPEIEANQVLLVWALENIVKNAIDALAGRGGRISVIALRDDDAELGSANHGAIHIVIADNGPGIAPPARDRIFEAGFSTKSGGWGVGLSLSRRIVEELHHGRITVQNRARGGAVFDVMLPVART